MRRANLVILLLMSLAAAPMLADSVSLSVDSGDDQGATALFTGGSLAMQFTLNQATDITTVDAFIDYPQPGSEGVWNLSVDSAPSGGATYWTSGSQTVGGDYTTNFLLAAGTYDLVLSAVSCAPPNCVNGIVAGWEYLALPSYSLTGGSIEDGFYQNGSYTRSIGALGTDIAGSVVPEPRTLLLVGSGLLGLAGLSLRRRRLNAHLSA